MVSGGAPRHGSAFSFAMKPLLHLAWLVLGLLQVAAAEGSSSSGSDAAPPTGGLIDVALRPSELGQAWTRRIRLVLDPQIRPNPYYPSKYDIPGMQPLDPVDPTAPFRRELDRVGAEAAIYMLYSLDAPITLAPAQPALNDPGLNWIIKQTEKIGKSSEPVAGPNSR